MCFWFKPFWKINDIRIFENTAYITYSIEHRKLYSSVVGILAFLLGGGSLVKAKANIMKN